MAGGIFGRSNGEGIFGGRRARRMAAAAEQERAATIGGVDIGVDELIASTADPAEAAAWRDQFESYKELALSHDELQQREGLNGLSTMAAAVRGAVDRRHASQEGFVIENARKLRDRYETAIKPMRELQANMEQLNALLADPEFNQNLPQNRGTLLTLLESTGRQMLTDPADMADALMSAGSGGGVIGALIRAAGGALDAKGFDFTKDDYGRLARAMYTFNAKRYESTVTPLEQEAAALEHAAGGLDFLPPGYSLTQFVTGGPQQEFASPLAEDYGQGFPPETKPIETALSALGGALTGDQPEGDPEAAAAGPEFGGVERRDAGMLERATGVFDIAQELNQAIWTAQNGGATVRAAPNGALFALYEDGRREEIPTSTVKREYVRNRLERGAPPARRRAASGVIQR